MAPSTSASSLRLAARGLQRLAQSRAGHQEAALGGEGLLLARLRGEARQLVDRVAQELLVAARGIELVARGLLRLFGGAQRVPCRGDLGRQGAVIAGGIEQGAVGGGIEQAAGLVLAMDLDQLVAELGQQADADRLVVDEGARAPVGAERAAQDQRRLARRCRARREARATGMAVGQVELGGDLGALGARPHQAAGAAVAEREPERIQQDRLAGAGFAGEHAERAVKGEIKPFDEDDVADREPCQHRRSEHGVPGPAEPGAAPRNRPAVSVGVLPGHERVGVHVPFAAREIVAEHGGRLAAPRR